MLFNSWDYFIFLPVVLALYYCLNRRWQNHMLLVASYFFYSCWDPRFSALLALSTVVDFFLGIAIHRAEEARRRKRLLVVSCVVNFGILGFFKYFNFFADSTARVLQCLGLHADPIALHVILPVGVSFYTFQTMNYVIDVYRREMEPTYDFLTYALFVSYFPHLVAGPIIRAELLIPQLGQARVVTNEKFASGCLLIFLGLFKKVAIADMLAPSVERSFAAPDAVPSLLLLKGVYCFALQVYGDFSGYTDIARGTSRLLGIELPENFNQPYLSASVTEFWRRWHISLSSWLRDYLYIPLGGSRHGRVKTYRNLMITMLLAGLWHGANWTFVLMGFLNGLYLVVHKVILDLRPTQPDHAGSGLPVRALKVVVTFHLVILTFIFFRASSFAAALAYVKGLLLWHGGFPVRTMAQPVLYGAVMLAIDLPQHRTGSHTVMLRWPSWLRGCVYAVMAFLLMMSRTGSHVPFVYFQF